MFGLYNMHKSGEDTFHQMAHSQWTYVININNDSDNLVNVLSIREMSYVSISKYLYNKHRIMSSLSQTVGQLPLEIILKDLVHICPYA